MARSSSQPPPALVRRARRAYERGRLLHGLRLAAPVAGLIVLIALLSDGPGWRLALGGGAVVAAALAFARGQWQGRAARTGILAALPPLCAPLLVTALHHGCVGCAGATLAVCVSVCGGAGVMAGVVLASLTAREPHGHRLRFAATAASLAIWLGLLGCAFAGVLGLAGLACGLIAGCAPVLAWARPR
jgi:hypothetical protein